MYVSKYFLIFSIGKYALKLSTDRYCLAAAQRYLFKDF